MIKIFNANKELKLISKKQLDFVIEHELDNADETLSFFVPVSSKEAEVIEQEGYIQTKDQEYVIKEVNKNNNSFNVVAKLNLEDFEGKPHKSFESRTATIEGAINLAIVGTGWTVAYSNITKKRTVRKVKIDTLELIQHIKKIYNAELVFNALEKKIYIYDHIGSYKGAYIRENINLTQLSGQSNSYDFYTRVEAEGAEGLTFADINNGKSYVEDYSYSNKVKTYFWKDERYTNPESLLEDARIKLEEMARPRFSYSVEMINLIKEGKEQQDYGLGDTIELVSKSMKVKELQRIVKLVEYPNDPERNYVELSNTLYSLEDINNKFEEAVETIDNITNQDGTIDGSLVDSIETSQIKDLDQRVNSITADKATVGQLEAVKAIIGELEATKASIAQLEALKITVGEIDAGKANITDLSAINAIIEILQANVGRIETLLSGNITAENIQTGGITSDRLTIANGFITNAMIDSINASKIQAGKIDTNKVTIQSESGAIIIAGNTQQFRDKNGVVRIQIGQDSQGNFTFTLFDETGRGIILDHTGIHEGAIGSGLIKNEMIGNGEIGGEKININSMITSINNGTATIKGSIIMLDTEAQTLEVAFNSLKNTAQQQAEIIQSHTTELKTQAGKIETLIKDTTIQKDGQSLKLKDEYSKLEQTVSGIEINVGRHESTLTEQGNKISSQAGTISAMQNQIALKVEQSDIDRSIANVQEQVTTTNNKVATIETNLNSITQRVSSTESTVSTHTTQLSTVDSRINTAKNSAINTASNDATSKANNAQTNAINSAKSYTDGQITTVNKTITNKVAEIKATTDSITQRVSSTETKVNAITTDFNNLQIGGRNLVKNSPTLNNSYNQLSTFKGTRTILDDSSAKSGKVVKIECTTAGTGFYCISWSGDDSCVGKKFTWSFYAKMNKAKTLNKIGHERGGMTSISVTTEWKKFTYTWTYSSSGNRAFVFYPNFVVGDIFYIKDFKIEEGDKATDWTAAPEDTDSAISNVQTQVTTTSNKVATIETNLSSITSRVSSTEKNITAINGNITSLQNRMNTAEQKITDSAIINTVQSTINTAKNEAINTANSATDNKLKSYATTSSLTQTANNIKAEFKEAGGYNLVKNSNFKKGLNGWNVDNIDTAGTSKSIAYWTDSNKYVLPDTNAVVIRGTNLTERYGINQTIKIKRGQKYTVSALSASHRGKTIRITIRNGNGGGHLLNVTSTTLASAGKNISNWNKMEGVFTAPTDSDTITLCLYMDCSGNDGYVWFTQLMINEGDVKQPWSPHPDEIYSGSTIIDASGITVNNGALTIKNKAGETVLNSDTNGNLVFTGVAKSQNGDQYVSLDSGGISFQDWNKKEQLLRMGSSSFSANRDMNGVTLAMPLYADFLRIAHVAKADLTNGWKDSDTQFNFIDFWSSTQTVGGITYKKGINVYAPLFINDGIQLYSGTSFPSELLGAISWNNGSGSISNLLGAYGDNGCVIGYKSGESLKARIIATEAAHPGTGDNIRMWGNVNCSGGTVHNATFSGRFVNSYANTFTRSLAETTAIEAEGNQVRINLENIQIKNGKAILNIPNRYYGMHKGYIINSIVKKGRGDVWVSEEQENRFIIEAENDIKINIELIIKLEDSIALLSVKEDAPIINLDENNECILKRG